MDKLNFVLIGLICFHGLIISQIPEVTPLHNELNDADRKTMDAVTFSVHVKPFTKEFCDHVIASAPSTLQKQIYLLTNPETRDQILPDKIILHGPPGSGKTTLALVALQQMGIPYILVNAPMLANEYKNSGAAGIARIIKIATALKAAVVIDEFDCLARNPRPHQQEDDNAPKALALLLDTLAKNRALFVGTTNDIKNIPEALQSRIRGSLYNMPLLNQASEHVRILKECLKDKKVDSSYTIDLVSKITTRFGLSTREINQITSLAFKLALEKNGTNPVISFEDFKIAAEKLLQDKEKLKKEDIDWWEMGKKGLVVIDVLRTAADVVNFCRGKSNTTNSSSVNWNARRPERNVLTNLARQMNEQPVRNFFNR